MSKFFQLPGAQVPVVMPNGMMNPVWYQAFQALARFGFFDSVNLSVNGGLMVSSSTLIASSVALTDNHAAATATLTNAPVAGNPTKWVPINDNGVTRNIPCW